ncbi:MAG: hypothetical protein WD638_04015 [Nitriliruptoraceae bacterium]
MEALLTIVVALTVATVATGWFLPRQPRDDTDDEWLEAELAVGRGGRAH